MTAIMERIRHGEKVKYFETKPLCKDGSAIDVSVTISPITGRNGVVTGASAVARDITEQKRAQLVLQSQSARTLSIFPQDLENVLDTIVAHTDLAIKGISFRSGRTKGLRTIRDEAMRGIDIVRKMLPSERNTSCPTSRSTRRGGVNRRALAVSWSQCVSRQAITSYSAPAELWDASFQVQCRSLALSASDHSAINSKKINPMPSSCITIGP
jgi:hypothetical protein